MRMVRSLVFMPILWTLVLVGRSWGDDLSGLKICLDPGHGAYPSVKPFETLINMKVGFYLQDYLESANVDTAILTRTNNVDNPSLSEREFIANSNNVDWFNSIHHNAFNGQANYSLVLYEELSSGDPQWPEAVTMSTIMGEDLFRAMRTTTFYVRGDRSFLGYNLGVLKDLQMPGELTEASFFDYTAEKNRLRNDDYLKMEARTLFASFLDYFGADPLTTGNLSGIVSDVETSQPINGVACTLWPDSLVYTVDDSANGLYIFDDLTPGTYSVSVEKEGYITSTDSLMVGADSFTRLDFQLPNTIPPTVITTVPDSGDTGVFVFSDIRLTFSRAMDPPSTEGAFLIAPDASGSFSWNTQRNQMTFQPDGYLQASTDYQVAIDTTARDAYGHYFDGDGDGLAGGTYAFGFRTARLDTTGPSVVITSPADGAMNVPVDVTISVEFDEFLDPTTIVPQNVILRDAASVPVARTYDYQEIGDHGILLIYPANQLQPGETYSVTLDTGLRDLFLNELDESFQWSFTTSSQTYEFTLIDDFEDGTGPWWDPEGSGSTMGTDPDTTTFLADTTVVNPSTGSTSSGRLKYEWNTSSGSWLIRVYFPPPYSDAVHFDTTYVLQVYLYGDGSNNKFRFCVDDNLPSTSAEYHEVSEWLTIDWVGWRLVEWDLGSDSVGSWLGNGLLEGDMRVDSFQLTYNSEAGAAKGTIYVDDLRLARPVTGVEDGGVAVQPTPSDFQLDQNYPNPFNAETNIGYQIHREDRVTLRIFNVTGQMVTSLIDEHQPAGSYVIRWNGLDDRGLAVASGVYFCHLQVGHRAKTRKMTLMR